MPSLSNDLRRHVFRDPAQDTDTGVHGETVSEFTSGQARMPDFNESLTAKTTAAPLPSVAAFMDTIFSKVGEVQNLAKGESIAKFRFVTQGYMRTEVALERGAGFSAERFPTEFGKVESALHKNDTPLPLKLQIKDHVTMLSEPWSAGGTNREESKIQGLVPMKLLDRPEYQDFRAPLGQAGQHAQVALAHLRPQPAHHGPGARRCAGEVGTAGSLRVAAEGAGRRHLQRQPGRA